MEKSMKRYMKVGTILHVSYKEVGSGEGPILECLKKIVTDPYFEAVEVAHMKDPVVQQKSGRDDCCWAYDHCLRRSGTDAGSWLEHK